MWQIEKTEVFENFVLTKQKKVNIGHREVEKLVNRKLISKQKSGCDEHSPHDLSHRACKGTLLSSLDL